VHHPDAFSDLNWRSVWLRESTGTLLEKRAAAAVYHPDLPGKEEYALRAQASIPLRTKRPLDNQKSPASRHTTRAGGADRKGHPGKVKARGGGGRSEEGMGAGINLLLAADNRG